MARVMIPTPSYIDLSLILRGLAALSVVWWHIAGYEARIPGFINLPGRVGVWLFFVISGYVIGYGFVNARYSFTARSLSVFYRNRLLRIYPLFLFISLLALLILAIRAEPLDFGPLDILAEFFAVQWSHTYRLCGVFWTLGIELQFYIVAPLLALLLCRGRIGLFLSVVLYAALLWWPIFARDWLSESLDNRTLLGNLHHFLAGMLVAAATKEIKSIGWRSTATLIALGVIGLSYTANFYHRETEDFWRVWGALLTDLSAVFLLIAHVAIERRRISASGMLANALLVVGVLSYGVYAWHGFLLVYFEWFSEQLIATVVTSLVLAFLSFRYVERPMLRMKVTADKR